MSMRFIGIVLLVWLAWSQGTTLAHEVRPGLLQLTEVSQGRFDVLWKVPARGDRVLALRPVFSGDCRQVTSPASRLADSAQLSRWMIECSRGALPGALSQGAKMFDLGSGDLDARPRLIR